MSGGHFDYKYYKLEELADDIERDFINGGKYEEEDWSISNEDLWKQPYNKRPLRWVDPFNHNTQQEKELLFKEAKSLAKSLKRDAMRAKELDWLMSGDYSLETYLSVLKKKGVIK